MITPLRVVAEAFTFTQTRTDIAPSVPLKSKSLTLPSFCR